MVHIGESNGRDGEYGIIFIVRHFIFEHFKTHLQMFCIHNIEESLAWLGNVMSAVPCTGKTTPE